jgi:type IV pilus assembly protein PilW
MSIDTKTSMKGMPMTFIRRRPGTMRGFTLVELMVSMVIGLIVLAALAQIFATSRGAYHLEEGLARVQESGRFAMEFLANDIRMAGYAGCNSQLPASKINNIAQPADSSTQMYPDGLIAHKYTGSGTANLTDWTPTLPSAFFGNNQVKPQSDVIIISRASTIDTNLTGNMTTANANIQILKTSETASEIKDGDILILADCQSADIFRANNVSQGATITTIAHPNSVNSTNFLSKPYLSDAQLMKLINRAYFIGTGASGEPALRVKELSSNSSGNPVVNDRELVDGIEELRILYGEDTDATADNIADQYRTADSVASWRRVMNVRIGMLARTPANVDTGPDNRSYTLVPGQTLAAKNDKRRRQLFTSTVQVRNRFN